VTYREQKRGGVIASDAVQIRDKCVHEQHFSKLDPKKGGDRRRESKAKFKGGGGKNRGAVLVLAWQNQR
jgi:hypothetical protein